MNLHLKKYSSGSSAVKESTYNAGDPSWILGLGTSRGEGIGYPLQSLAGEFHGQRNQASYSPWGRKELGFPDSSVSKESICNAGDLG